MEIKIEKTVDASHLSDAGVLEKPLLALQYEQEILRNATVITEGQYDGGMWHLKLLSNGGFFMALESDEPFDCFNMGNQTVSKLSGDAFSVAINMAACSHLSFRLHEHEGYTDGVDRLSSNYHLLREYAYQGNDDPEDGELCPSAFTSEEIASIYRVLD